MEMVESNCGMARWAPLGGCVLSGFFTLHYCGGRKRRNRDQEDS